MNKPTRRVDASKFQRPLETLAETLIQRLKNEWPHNLAHLPFAQSFCHLTLRYCLTVFRAECGMFADERREDYRWRWDGVALLPASNRTLLDCLFNIVFMFEDIESRSVWYHKSGWREQKLEYDRWKTEYGSDPEWTDWLTRLADLIERGKTHFSISEEEAGNPRKAIVRWPSSGLMPDYEVNPQNRPAARQFLHYLADWYYRSHSGQAHMSFLGMMKLGVVVVLDEMPKDERDKFSNDGIPRLMTSHLGLAATLLLCTISELQNYFRFPGDIELRLLALWHTLMPDFPDAVELFTRRYSSLFPALLVGSNV